MPWTNTFTKEQIPQRPDTVEVNGAQTSAASMSDLELNQIGWFELKPLVMENEVINPQWS